MRGFMFLVQVIFLLAVAGIAWRFIVPYIADPFRSIIIVLVVIAFCLWLLSAVNLIQFPAIEFTRQPLLK